jgi:hypothetical protein
MSTRQPTTAPSPSAQHHRYRKLLASVPTGTGPEGTTGCSR